MNLRILGALLRKEVCLMKRNPFIPKIIFIMPVMVMLVVPLVTTLDVKNVNIAVVDYDNSILSRRIISDMDATAELSVINVRNHKEAMDRIENGDADVAITIPANYSRDMSLIDIQANGVNSTKGMLGTQYAGGSIALTLKQWQTENGISVVPSYINITNRYNPTLNFQNYMIPALMVVLLIIICGFLPTLNIVNEKESGTIEAMNVTPVGKFTFVMSKLIPFWIIGLIVITIGIIAGYFIYDLKPAGNIGAIYLASILFILFMSGMGVSIANKSATMLQSIFVMFAFIIIFQLMGGLFTPIGSMPQWAQTITYAIPPRYFNEIMRSVYLKGATVSELWQPYLCLTIFAVITCILASITYRKQS